MDHEARLTAILGASLKGEHVITAITGSTRRWYTPFSRFNAGEEMWDVALTELRLLIVPHVGDWAKLPDQSPNLCLDAQRADIEVQRFMRTGVGSWWMKLNARTAGHWSLHGSSFLYGHGSARKAREIAEALGWSH